MTFARLPSACRARMTPSAVPQPRQARLPVLQWVCTRSGPAPADLVAHRDGGLDDGQRRGLDRRAAQRYPGRDRRYLAAEVDGGRPRAGDALDLCVQPRAVPALTAGLVNRERYAERAGRAEQRGTPDGQPGDRVDQLVHGRDAQHPDLMRQRRLIESLDVPVPPREHVVFEHTVESMLLEQLRDDVVRVCRELASSGLVVGTSGNVSARTATSWACPRAAVDT